MKIGKFTFLGLLASFLLWTSPAFGQDKPYKEGTVWSVSLIKVKPGMLDVYLRDLGSARKKLMEEAKKQGLIVSEKMFIGSASNRDDWDVMFMVEYKNWAALDGLSDKFDALALKLVGTEEKQVQMMVKRTETREILGDKMLQEITLK
ncbi:MAG: hypothetical protein QM722_22625 [Piscinibacter sp.]